MINILSKLNNIIKSFYNKIIKKKDNIVYKLNEEIDTGDIWIDGRKIYLYVFEVTLTTNGTIKIKSPIYNKYYEIIDNWSIIYPVNERTMMRLSTYYLSTWYAFPNYDNITEDHLVFRTAYDGGKTTLYIGSKVRIFLKYTK